MSGDSSANVSEVLENNRIEPFTLLHDIFVNWWIILLGALAAAMLTYTAVNLKYVPEYSSTATFAVSARSSASSYNNLSSANTMATTLQKIIESSAMEDILENELGVDVAEAKIETNVVQNTNLLELTVTTDSPKESFDIINAVIDNYSSISYYSIGNAVMEVLQAPGIPFSPDNPLNVGDRTQQAFLLAAAVLILLFGLLSFQKDTVKCEEEIEKKLDARSLGAIAFEMKYKSLREFLRRRKSALLINNPLAGFSFVESYKKFSSRVEYRMEKHDCHSLVVTSVSENEGKSTVAANLAITIAQRGQRVILLDGDLRRPSQFLIFGLKPEEKNELGEYLKKENPLKDIVMPTDVKRLFFMGGRNCYSSSTDLLQNEQLKKLLETCKKLADYVIIDTPPVGILGDAEIYAQYADAVLLVVRQNFVYAEDINDALDRFRGAKCRVLGVVLNGVQTLSGFTSSAVGRYSSRYGYGRYGKYGKRQRD